MDDTKEQLSQEDLDKIAKIEEERKALSEKVNAMVGKYYALAYPAKGPSLHMSINHNNNHRTIITREISQNLKAFTIHPTKNHWDANFTDCLFVFTTGIMRINLNILDFLEEIEGGFHEIDENQWLSHIEAVNSIVKEYIPENKDF